MYQESTTVLEVGGAEKSYGVHKQISLNDIYEAGFIKSVSKDVSGWVFGECKNNHRSRKDLQYLTKLVYDIDKADRDIYDEVVIAVEDANLNGLLHTTHSNDPEKDKHRLRLILDVDGQIPVNDYKAFYEYALKKIPFLHKNKQWLDKSGNALSRFFYKPSYHPDREQYKRMDIIGEGDPVSFKAYEDHILESKEEDKKTPDTKGKNIKPNGKHKPHPQNEQNEHDVEFNLNNYFKANCEEEEWRNIIWSLKSLVTHHGWDEEWVKNLLIEWSKTSDKHTWDEAEEHFNSLWERDVEEITYGTFIHMLRSKDNYTDLPLIIPDDFDPTKFTDALLESDPELKKWWDYKQKPLTKEEIFQAIHNNFYFMKGSGKQFLLSRHDLEQFRKGEIEQLPQYKDEKNQKLEVKRVLSIVFDRTMDKYQKEILKQFNSWMINAQYSKAKTLIGFYPKNDNPDVINLFPKEFKTVYKGEDKKVRSIFDHDFNFPDIHELFLKCLCNSRKDDYEYLIKWIALRIQKPEKKPLTVLIFLGTKGTGKGTLELILQELFGHIVIKVSNIEMILQKHNQILINSFIVICDEANFIFNPHHMGRFKSYVTDRTVDIEPKNLPPFTVASCHAFIIFSNNRKVMNEDRDGRRSVYFDTVKYDPNDEDENKDFYKRFYKPLTDNASDNLKKQIEEFRGFLDRLDISEFDATDRPKSLQYAEQKLDSLQGLEKYLYEVADTGKIKIYDGNGTYKTIYPPLFDKEFVSTQELIDTLDALNQSKYKNKITDKGLAKQFRDFLEDPTAEPERKMVDLGYKKVKRMGWYIESISKLREIFIKRYHLGDNHRWTVSNEKLAEIHEDLKDKGVSHE